MVAARNSSRPGAPAPQPAESAPSGETSEVTRLLRRWRTGDEEALDHLMPLIYAELRRLARIAMRTEGGELTLQPTALVSEAYLRLVEVEVPWQDRVHFYSVASSLMRRILVDEARRRKARKRGGAQRPHSLDELLNQGFEPAGKIAVELDFDLERLDRALSGLEAFDPRKSKVVELRFFGGLTIEETAAALGLSHATVERDLKVAKAWLAKELKAPPP